MSTVPITLAKRFADSLDRRDYDALFGLIATDCQYEIQDRLIGSNAAIIQAYRENTEWAFDVFDRIEFESDVIPESEVSARITFTDHLYFGSDVHDYRCQQILHLDNSGRIDRIIHIDLAGEAAALRAYFEVCGIVPPRRIKSISSSASCATSSHTAECEPN